MLLNCCADCNWISPALHCCACSTKSSPIRFSDNNNSVFVICIHSHIMPLELVIPCCHMLWRWISSTLQQPALVLLRFLPMVCLVACILSQGHGLRRSMDSYMHYIVWTSIVLYSVTVADSACIFPVNRGYTVNEKGQLAWWESAECWGTSPSWQWLIYNLRGLGGALNTSADYTLNQQGTVAWSYGSLLVAEIKVCCLGLFCG